MERDKTNLITTILFGRHPNEIPCRPIERDKTILKIVIVADTHERANWYFLNFLNDNRESVLIPGKNKLVMYDGTIIEKYAMNSGNEQMRGKRFDQVILCTEKTDKMLGYVLNELLCGSQVPSQYWLLEYDV